MTFHVPERHRITTGPMRSYVTHGNNGAFEIRMGSRRCRIIASDEGGWEHVSISHSDRTPNWEEMCRIKAIFWDDEDCVVQYHPPKSEYVNNHPYVLHLWRPTEGELPRPPKSMV